VTQRRWVIGFERVKAGVCGLAPRLDEGQLSVDRQGEGRVHATALGAVDIVGEWVVVLADSATLRLAIRQPREDEDEYKIRARVPKRYKNQPDLRHRKINLRRALLACGLRPAEAAGRYPIMTKDDLLIISLLPEESPEGGGRKRKAK
jgi:hypothetical protein